MKLKTLKDLQLGYEGYLPEDERIRQELRQEAIKWIVVKGYPANCKDKKCKYCRGANNWIKHFFNITEEDLSK